MKCIECLHCRVQWRHSSDRLLRRRSVQPELDGPVWFTWSHRVRTAYSYIAQGWLHGPYADPPILHLVDWKYYHDV
jgi:hypothetical protein